MGQRLNIEIHKNEKALANAYYHWSAYTSSAMYLLKKIIEKFDEVDAGSDLEKAVRLLELTGAGIPKSEEKNIRNDPIKDQINFSFQPAFNRNEGLIAVTERGIDETRAWEEGRVTIDLATRTFSFNVFWRESEEDFLDCYGEEKLKRCDRVEEAPSFFNAPFEKVKKLSEFIENHKNGVVLPDGNVLMWIE